MAIIDTSIMNVFDSPKETFYKIKESSDWFIEFIVWAVGTTIYGHLLSPFSQRLMMLSFNMQTSIPRTQQIMNMVIKYQRVALLFAFIPLFIKLILFTVVLYYLIILLNSHKVRLKTIFSIVIHSEFILLLMVIVNLFILYIKGINAVNNIFDLQAVVGLEYFIHDKTNNIPLYTFLSNFNVFTIWYIVVLTIGVSVVTELEKWKSAIIVSLVWLFGVGFQVAFASLSVNMQHMMGRWSMWLDHRERMLFGSLSPCSLSAPAS